MAVTLPVKVLLRADNRLGPVLKSTARGFSRLGAGARKFGSTIRRNMTLPLIAFGAAALRSAVTFERSFNGVIAVTEGTEEEFEKLNDEARRLGKTTQFSAAEAADAMSFLGQAGFKANEILASTSDFLNLAAAGQLELAEAADIGSNIMAAFTKEASQAGEVADVLAATSINANTNVAQLGEAMVKFGPFARKAGIDIREAAAAIGLLGNAGIQGEMAGNVLTRALSNLIQTANKPGSDAAKVLDRLGIRKEDIISAEGGITSVTKVIANLQFALKESGAEVGAVTDELSALVKGGASTEEIEERMRELGRTSTTIGDLMVLFGLRAGPGMAAAILQGAPALQKLTDRVNETGVAQEVADIRMRGAFGRIKELTSAFSELGIAIGESGLLNFFSDVVKGATAATRAMSNFGHATGIVGKVLGVVLPTFRGPNTRSAAAAASVPPSLGGGGGVGPISGVLSAPPGSAAAGESMIKIRLQGVVGEVTSSGPAKVEVSTGPSMAGPR